jgi:hypothetical protein
MPVTLAPLSYTDAMADWAEAEIASPYMTDFGFSYLGQDLRKRIASSGLGALDAKERQLALAAILHFRQPLLRAYQVNRSAEFFRCRLNRSEVAALEVIPEIGVGAMSMARLTERTGKLDRPGEIEVAQIVERIAEGSGAGRPHVGHPFVVERSEGAPPYLIEGYKRTLAWLIHGRSAWLDVILVRPALID